MNPIRRILVPTDFSPHAARAFRVAHDLAKATGASVVVFHVSRPPAVASDGSRTLSTLADGEKGAWDQLRAIQPTDPEVHVEHEVIVADRPDAAHILELIEARGCDLVVMGTHGRTGLRSRLCGSVTEKVVRRAHCPVMVVKAPAPKAAETPAAVSPGKAQSPSRGEASR